METKRAERINWLDKVNIENIVLAIGSSVNGPVNKNQVSKKVSEMYGRKVISVQLNAAFKLIEKILGSEVKVGNGKYEIKSLAIANDLINKYFSEDEKSKRDEKGKSEKDFQKIMKIFNITSSYGKQGVLSSELLIKLRRQGLSIDNIRMVGLMTKYNVPGFSRTIESNQYRVRFYSDESRKFIESRMGLLPKFDINSDSESDTVVRLLDSEVKSKSIEILYLKSSENGSSGITEEDLYKELNSRFSNKHIIRSQVKDMLIEFSEKLDQDTFRVTLDHYKILSYSEAIRIINPSKSYVKFNIKVPKVVKVRSTLIGVEFNQLDVMDEDDTYITYEVTAKNSRSLVTGLIKLCTGFGVKTSEESEENIKLKSIILNRHLRDKIEATINSFIDSVNEII